MLTVKCFDKYKTNRVLKKDFLDIFYAKNPMILRVIFQIHVFFNSLLSVNKKKLGKLYEK